MRLKYLAPRILYGRRRQRTMLLSASSKRMPIASDCYVSRQQRLTYDLFYYCIEKKKL